ncbi:dienelactone hydrolase family protein [Herbaspirillum huttiense]|uniref:dienelactone hydrolase family protein n=1 Tax=Herbaspirillum huttiense TaxID=863372 RepID=UPI0039AF8C13
MKGDNFMFSVRPYRILIAVVIFWGGIAETFAAPLVQATPLEDSAGRTISFESVTPKRIKDFVERTVADKATVTGRLSFPEAMTSPVPAVVILHGSSGVNPGEKVWAQRLNALGFASFVVDSFTGRGVSNTEADQTQLSMSAGIADAYFALRLLAADPRIDKKKISVMGFSRGGIAALYSALDPFRRAVIDDDLHFAAHIAFYPGCGIHYASAHLDGAPILMLLGGKDNYTPAAPCVEYADTLRKQGAQVTVKVYPDAYHGFDRPTRLHVIKSATSARDCHGEYDLDTSVFTMYRGAQRLSGADATAEARHCLSYGC